MRLLNKMLCFALAAQTGLLLANPAFADDPAKKSQLAESTITCPWIKSALAAEDSEMGSITILAPTKGAVLKSDVENKLEFNLKLGPKGNHVHIYIDDQSPIVDRDVGYCPCSIALPKLSPGKHTIVVKEAAASHTLTGVQSSVTVTVK